MWGKIFSKLQLLGKSLMVPVSVLPAAGLLVALGRVLQSQNSTALINLGKIFYSGGLAIFEQLPAVFAVGVAIGFTQGAGVAGLASVVGYFTLSNVLTVQKEILGLNESINLGVFGGIIIGYLAAKCYERFHQIQLPQILGFFSGKRMVPIVTAAASLGVAIVLSFIWPPVQELINHLGLSLMNSSTGPAFYAAGKRLLIPVGLHHVYYPPFLFQFGEFITSTGQIVHGESARYFAGDPTAGKVMASEFPIMLFGLPAAALAMFLRARPENRKVVGGVMLSAALTSILTGITEPIEFAFIFAAPLLFIFHVTLAFISGLLTQLLDIHLGYTFSASLIDFVLGLFNQKNGSLLFLVVGPLMFAAYFVSFYFAIGKWKLKTLGREEENADVNTTSDLNSTRPIPSNNLAVEVLQALGGAKNIIRLDACITRLRLQLKDNKLINQAQLKKLGAHGIMQTGAGVQVIFGTKSETLREQIALVMKHSHELTSPLKGKLIPLSEVPDETFRDKILGDGVAFIPEEGVLYSPLTGTVVNVFKTGHAVGLVDDQGVEVLLHVGINTVNMQGQGFKTFVKEGDRVAEGQKLVEFDLSEITRQGHSTITPMIVTSSDKTLSVPKWGQVNQGDQVVFF